ncbi:hypothetical protein IH779_00905 [Patescibacteria group bacterium]|nr:hypothetical protein [Patescibacteria group bacterium]
MEKKNIQYISLQKATEYCFYSQEYLSLLARKGKLKAVKFGRNWVTTKEWIEEYVKNVENNNQVHQKQEKAIYKKEEDRGELSSFTEVPSGGIEVESLPSPPQGPGQADPSPPPDTRFRERVRLATLIALFFVFLVAGGFFAVRQGGNEFARWVEKGGFKNVLRETNSYVIGLNQELDKGIVSGWAEINELVYPVRDLIVNSVKRIPMDISNGVQEVGQTGDFVLKGAVQSLKESSTQVSQDTSQFSDDFSQLSGETRSTAGKVTSFGVAGLNQLADVSQEIPKSIAEIFQDLGQGLARQVSSIQGGLEGLTQTIVQGLKITGQGIFYGFEGIGKGAAEISQGVIEGGKTISQVSSGLGTTLLQGTSNGLEWLAEGIKSIGQGAENVASGFKNITSKLVKIVTTPFQREIVVRTEKKVIPENLEQELSRLSEEIQKLKLEGLPAREIIREVIRVTQIEPIREITREIIRIDESDLFQVKASLAVIDTQISSLEKKTSRGLYAPSFVPTTSFSVSGNITEGGVALSSKYISIPGGSLQGDILIGSWARLAAGATGQFLQTQGVGADPVWASVVSGLWTDGGTATYLTATSDDLALGGTDSTAPFFMDISAGNLTLTGSLTSTSLNLTNAINQIVLDSDAGNTGTITMAALGASRTWTLPDATGTIISSGNLTDITSLTGLNAQNALSLGPFGTSAGNTGEVRFLELAASGTNYVGFKSPDAIAANVIWTLPSADGTADQVLSTNASGVLSWATAGGLFTDGGAITYLTATADDVALGGTGSTSPFFMDVSTEKLTIAGSIRADDAFLFFDGSTQAIAATPSGFSWQVSTAVFLQRFSVTTQEFNPNGLFFKPDGKKMYVIGTSGDDVNEYDLSTPWDVSTAVFLQTFSVSTQETSPMDVFFKPDGKKMYVIGFSGDDVNEYDLSTPWDVSTAVFLQVFSVSTQETLPMGLFFKPDGTKMYVIGTSGLVNVNEYDLSTPWNVSTAVFLQRFKVIAQETTPSGVSFKPDGAKMYVIGVGGNEVNEYDLSTAWDVSTAVFLQKFSVLTQESASNGVFFKPDGKKMYVTGDEGDDVNEYDLSTPWDVSTAVFLQTFSVSTQETSPTDVFFKPDGSKMYVLGNSGDEVNEYDLGLNILGLVRTALGSTASTTAVCSSLAGATAPTAGTAYELRDCSGTPAADYMEMYAVEEGTETGDIVVTGTHTITTEDGNTLVQLIKSSSAYAPNIIGIVSDPEDATDFNSIGYNIAEEDNPMPIALSGRVTLKVSLENGPIAIGDPLTSSSIPGVAMRATRSGPIVGKALESFDSTQGEIGKILVFVSVSYYLSEELTQTELAGIVEETTFNPLQLLASDFVKFFKQGLAKLGLFVENGVLKVSKIIAEFIEIENLKVGSPEKPTGITLYDEMSGQPYCIKIRNGQMISYEGECVTVLNDPNPPSPEPLPIEPSPIEPPPEESPQEEPSPEETLPIEPPLEEQLPLEEPPVEELKTEELPQEKPLVEEPPTEQPVNEKPIVEESPLEEVPIE